MYEYSGLTVHLNYIKILHYKKPRNFLPLFYPFSFRRKWTGCFHPVTKPFCYLHDSGTPMSCLFNHSKPSSYYTYRYV
jgi:hypothetical protein